MYIQTLIRNLLYHSSAVFHDAQGNEISKDRIGSDYSAIKHYVLDRAGLEDIVAIHLPYDFHYLLTILACMEVGVPYIPLRQSWPATRIDQIKLLTNYTILIDDNQLKTICRGHNDACSGRVNISPDAPLYIMCTSGTTGEPKAVVIQRKAYEHFLKWFGSELQCGPDCRILFTADFTFDVSLQDVGLLLLKHCESYFSQFNGNLFHLAHEIDSYEIHSIATVPNNLNLLLQNNIFERSSLQSLKQLCLAGSRFFYGTYRSIWEKLPRLEALYNFYGPTEATIYCLYQRLSGAEMDEVKEANVTIGRAAPGLRCLLRDQSGKSIERPHSVGELLVAGPQVMREYLGDSKRTSQSLSFINGNSYYGTGDIAFFDDSGKYYIIGRLDETLKRRGYRVNLLDIDSYIQKLDCVLDSATIAIPDTMIDHLLVTYVIPKQPIPEIAMRQKLSQVLVEYQIPDYIFYTNSFPTNNSGKICKESLKRMFVARMPQAS